MSKEELIELLLNGETDVVVDKLENDGVEIWERDFLFVLEDIVEKYFKKEK